MHKNSRRESLKKSAAETGSAFLAHSIPSLVSATPRSSVTMPLSLFGYRQVELMDGILRRQFDENHATCMTIDEDGFAKALPSAERAGGAGTHLGGWYDNSDDFDPDNPWQQDPAGFTKRIDQFLTIAAKHHKLRKAIAASPSQRQPHYIWDSLTRALEKKKSQRWNCRLQVGWNIKRPRSSVSASKSSIQICTELLLLISWKS